MKKKDMNQGASYQGGGSVSNDGRGINYERGASHRGRTRRGRRSKLSGRFGGEANRKP